MARQGPRDLMVGAMFALALIVISITIMAVGGESRLFGKKVTYRVAFPSADGLVVGSPVKISGVQVGTVRDIELSTDPERQGIEVSVAVDRAWGERVREDSQATLRILQLLSGEKFVEILPGTAGLPPLPEDAFIRPLADSEILEQASMAAENLNAISVSLKNILSSLERGEGLMGQMISDPEFGKEGLDALVGSLNNVRSVSEDLLAGRGFLGRLLQDETLASKVDELSRTVDNLARITDSIDLTRGAFGALLEEEGDGEQMIVALKQAAVSLRNFSARLEDQRGLVGRLLYDEAYSGKLAEDIGAIAANLAEITQKINTGQGTLGALVNERVLHDGMEEVVAGVNDSKFSRWLLRHYQKKGVKLEAKRQKRQPPERATAPGGD